MLRVLFFCPHWTLGLDATACLLLNALCTSVTGHTVLAFTSASLFPVVELLRGRADLNLVCVPVPCWHDDRVTLSTFSRSANKYSGK